MTQPQLTRAYRMKRQRIPQLIKQFGIETVSDPDKLLKALSLGRASKLKRTLSDPSRRKEIRDRLAAQAKIPELRAEITNIRAGKSEHIQAIRQHFQALASTRKQISIKHKHVRNIIAELNS
jgi:hypothetical protein